MWRVAIYGREAPGRAGRAGWIGRWLPWRPRWPASLAGGTWRPTGTRTAARPTGLSRLLAEAPGRIDLLVVDGYGRLSPNHRSWVRCWPSWGRRGPGRGAASLGGPAVRPAGGEPGAGRYDRPSRPLIAALPYRGLLVVTTATSAPAVMNGAIGRID